MKVLLALNKAAMDAEAQDQADAARDGLPPPDQRFTFGMYFFSERSAQPPAASSPESRDPE